MSAQPVFPTQPIPPERHGGNGNNGHGPLAATTPPSVAVQDVLAGAHAAVVALRRFILLRHRDVSGISGVGVVAEGVRFTDGSVVLRWRREPGALAVFASVGDLLNVHGHGGATEIQWIDD